MTDVAQNPATAELRDRLRLFSDWRVANLRGDEKGESQVFLDRFFQALGWPGVFEAGATLEFRVKNTTGGTSFADLLWKPRVLVEMKKAGADLSRHLQQAFDYWVHAVPDRPRYVVLCNFDQFWIYDFELQLDQPVERLGIADLESRWEALGFLLPQAKEPLFNNDLVAVTREAAADVAKVFMSLKDRGVKPAKAQRFALQCVMAMFAEDIGLLPEHFFTRALEDAHSGSEAYDLIGGLFREMNTPGFTAGGRYAGTPYFNGGLFLEVDPQELTSVEVELLKEAASTEWSDVRPEIFGTLFEGSMDAGERHASGAHFTSQADIARVVNPVIVRPWHERIEAASSINDLNRILEAMSQFRVLDPSCGSGNFLYVAYREMRRLEREVIEKIRDRRKSQDIAAMQTFQYVSPEQFFGIDINPFAVEVAKVTLLLGKKLADDEMHQVGATLPLNNLDKNIVMGDSLFDDWPQADVVIGNPPYLGRRRMVEELGADYCSRLDQKFGPKGVADFVTYWFPKTHDHLPEGGRAGYVATKTIKQGDGRKASLDYVVDHGGAIIDAVASMPWSGEAVVTVAIVNWQKGGTPPTERTLWIDPNLEPLVLTNITSALSPEIDLRSAVDIAVNAGNVHQGQTLGVTPAFKIGKYEASKLTRSDSKASTVIHPLLGGDQLLGKTSVDSWVIDIPDFDAGIAWRDYPSVMKYLESAALPIKKTNAQKEADRNEAVRAQNPASRVNTHHAGFLDRWWTLAWRRDDYFAAKTGVRRYVVLPRVASHQRMPVFTFVDGAFNITDSCVSFPFEDDYSLGILQSSAHITWFRERCSTLKTDLRYTSKSVFQSFPWPQSPSPEDVASVAEASKAIVEHRGTQFRLGYSLGAQYDVLRKPGKSTLRTLHETLDAAVFKAYGFDPSEDVLTQTLELNLLVSERQSRGDSVTGPGAQPTLVSPSLWSWPAPAL